MKYLHKSGAAELIDDRWMVERHFDDELLRYVTVKDLNRNPPDCDTTSIEFGFRVNGGDVVRFDAVFLHRHLDPDPATWNCDTRTVGEEIAAGALPDEVQALIEDHLSLDVTFPASALDLRGESDADSDASDEEEGS